MKSNNYIYKFEDNLYVNLTNSCCNNCAFCIRNNGDTVNGKDTLWLEKEPTKEEVVKAIQNCTFYFNDVVFCGYGEPTYKLEEMLFVAEFVHSLNKKTRLNTNGLGDLINNGQNTAKLLKGKIDVVSVSLNESNAKKYQDLCQSVFGEDAFYAMVEFTKNCVKEGIDTVMSVVDVGNVDVCECQKIADSVGAKLRVRSYIAD